MGDMQKLPLELIFQVVASLVRDTRTILRPSNPATKALLAFALVCRATYPVAANLLRQHCVYIDNDRRLRELIRCVETNTTPLRPITSLFLAPFRGHNLDDQPTAIWVRELFCLVHPSLTRLVIDMPLRSLSPASDHLSVRKTLRSAFCLLTSLEEFVSVRDELYLDVLEREWQQAGPGREVDVWSLWPRLRRLALYNVDADDHFWKAVRSVEGVELVVLTRADGLETVCMKTEYLDVGTAPAAVAAAAAAAAADGTQLAQAAAGMGTGIDSTNTTDKKNRQGKQPPRPLKVVLVNVENDQPIHLAGRWKWDKTDPLHLVQVSKYDVPTSFYGDEDPIELCQQWVKAAAVRGDIWDWEGPLIQQEPRGDDGSIAPLYELEA